MTAITCDPFASVETVHPPVGSPLARMLGAMAQGRPALLAHPEAGRTYITTAAQNATAEFVTLATVRGRGVLRAAMLAERITALGIPALPGLPGVDGLCVPVDLGGHDRAGIDADRAATLRALADPATSPHAFVMPGHVFAVQAGECETIDDACAARVMTEAAVLAGCAPLAGYSEAVTAEGASIGAGADAERLARRLGVPLVDVRTVLAYRERVDPAVEREIDAPIPTPYGSLSAIGYVSRRSSDDFVAFLAGDTADVRHVHVHRRCRAGDVFSCLTCACGERLRAAQAAIQASGTGLIVYCDVAGGGAECPAAGDRLRPSWDFTAGVAAVLRDLGVADATISTNALLRSDDLAALDVPATLSAPASQ